MKTISELQSEVRGIKKDLVDIEERLTNIDEELSNHKDSANTSSKGNNIYELAKTFPKIEHPILNEDRTVQNNYFSILLMISTMDDSINDEQLLFLQRIAISDEQNSRLDKYLANLGSINFKTVLYQLDETVKREYSKQLLLDMIILSNLSKSVNRKSYEIIASISAFLGVERQEVKEITQVAKAILLNDSTYLLDINDTYYFDYDLDFDYYLCEVPGFQETVDQQQLNIIRLFHSQNDF